MTTAPDYHAQEEFQNRHTKLKEIQLLGIDPYPAKFTPSTNAKSLHDQHAHHHVGNSDDAASGTTPDTIVAGRLVLFRAMGKNAFCQLQDESGRIQVMFNRDQSLINGYSPPSTGPSHIKFLERLVDLGDFIGVEGHLFRTMKGELTIFAKKVTLLCKALLPLPDKHSGLTHKEVRYRKRWLDLISHEEVRATFRKRSQILKILRNVCEEHGFMEVETPILQSVYGGANAKPFTTHLNALKQEMFLRISLEIPLKKLIVGGMERVFEIGKVFRNEGIDRTHNPEFTELEAYAAYWDYEDLMDFTEKLFEAVALGLYDSTTVYYTGFLDESEELAIDFKRPWKRLSMKKSIATYADVDVDSHDDDTLRQILSQRSTLEADQLAAAPRGMLINHLFEQLVEHHLIQPCHIIDFPIETTPLCKLHRDPRKREERIVERVESYVLANEISNGYSELNDPVLQRELLEGQARRRDLGDEEAPPMDEEFVEAICQGMPPTGGIGFGVDRLVMLLTSAHSIRDVLYFPLMRGEHAEG